MKIHRAWSKGEILSRAKEKARTSRVSERDKERKRDGGAAMRQRSPAVLRLGLCLLAVSASPAFLGSLAADLSKGELSCSFLACLELQIWFSY